MERCRGSQGHRQTEPSLTKCCASLLIRVEEAVLVLVIVVKHRETPFVALALRAVGAAPTVLRTHLAPRGRSQHCEKTVSLKRVSPMFVPSLSW